MLLDPIFLSLPDDEEGDSSLSDPPGGSPPLCTYGTVRENQALDLAPTKLCSPTAMYGKYGVPGGAVCEGAESVARCPRPWQ